MKKTTITPLRYKVLRLLHDKAPGGVMAGTIAHHLVPSRNWWPQSATRWGCGYMQPLVDRGFVLKDIHVDCGGAMFTLTTAGATAVMNYEYALACAKDLEHAMLYPFA